MCQKKWCSDRVSVKRPECPIRHPAKQTVGKKYGGQVGLGGLAPNQESGCPNGQQRSLDLWSGRLPVPVKGFLWNGLYRFFTSYSLFMNQNHQYVKNSRLI